MKISDLVASVRLAVDDTSKARYSDFTILSVIDDVMSGIANSLHKHSSELLFKSVKLDTTKGFADLPEDFVKPVCVESGGQELSVVSKLTQKGYKIVGNQIKTKLPEIDLEYSYAIPSHYTVTDSSPFPMFFDSYIKKYVVMVLTNNTENASAQILPVIEGDVVSLMIDRGRHEIDRPMPFIV